MKTECLYCGKEANTKEHVPSKSLLEKPYPQNLFTFPACQICNQAFSLDEEYFLNILATLSESQTLINRTQPGGQIYRSRERSDRLYQKIVNSLVQEDGRTFLKPEIERIKRIIEKYAFGIYYLKYKKLAPLNLFKLVGFHPYNAQETRPEEIILLTHNESFQPKRWNHIQLDVFSYIVVRDWRRNNSLTMIIQIHNTAWFVIEIPYPSSTRSNSRTNNLQHSMFEGKD